MTLTESDIIEQNMAAEQAEDNRLRQELQDILNKQLAAMRSGDEYVHQEKVFFNRAEADKKKSYLYATTGVSYVSHSLAIYLTTDGRIAGARGQHASDTAYFFVDIEDLTAEEVKKIMYNIAHPINYCF